MEQLREDNKKLLALLKKTKEYQEFANFVEDSGGTVRGIDKEVPLMMGQENRNDEENWIP